MTEPTVHQKKQKKNIAVLLMIITFCAMVFGITIAKISSGIEQGAAKTTISDE